MCAELRGADLAQFVARIAEHPGFPPNAIEHLGIIVITPEPWEDDAAAVVGRGCQMGYGLAAAHCLSQCHCVEKVSAHALDLVPMVGGGGEVEDAHLVPLRQQFVGYVGADETRAPRDENLHAVSLSRCSLFWAGR